jgi:signal peptidase I
MTVTGKEAPPENDNWSKDTVIKNVKSIFFFILIVLLLRGSAIEAYKIPSESMVPTLLVNDYILVSKISFGLRLPFVKKTLFRWSSPVRGDVVVFTREDDPDTTKEDEGSANIIKRVIGLPGDKVEVKGTDVLINGVKLEEHQAIWQDGGSIAGDFGPVTVPKDSVFVMGDNRDHSKDSRFWNGTHFLPMDNIKGRALLVYLSTSNFSRIGTLIR